MIKLSILCITYNHADYIRKAIDGFLMQKARFDFEILIGNDCSTDNTGEIVESYLPNGQITFVNHKSNQGKSGINNLISLMKLAKGKYSILCEGDDYWTDENKIQKQVDFLEANPG